MSLSILVLGSGGREHALVWALSRSPRVSMLSCAPGNPGIGRLARCLPVPVSECLALAELAEKEHIDLTVVGPEVPLAEGIVDLFQERGLAIFGPTKRAAELEWSKAFAKGFMVRHGVPTAGFAAFEAPRRKEAEKYIEDCPLPVVLKADGLAAGKGVVICREREEAARTLAEMFGGSAFGDAGTSVVIEEFLTGEEASVFAVTDGTRFATLASAQDHKRALDGDRGKNTGGMGAYAPTPFVPDDLLGRVEREIIAPVISGMAAEGRPYSGCLYAGLMITGAGPKVIEFNCRFGDPETQVVLPLFPGDLAQLLYESAAGRLTDETLASARTKVEGSAACIVLASAGYPDSYPTGIPIDGLESLEGRQGVVAFHAGTALRGEQLVTAGGRVLGVTAVTGGDLAETLREAYSAVERIAFEGMQYRRDIGQKALRAR